MLQEARTKEEESKDGKDRKIGIKGGRKDRIGKLGEKSEREDQ